MSPVSKAQQKAVAKYEKQHYDKYLLRMPKGKKDIIKAHTEVVDGSINKFINRAITETISRDREELGLD